MELEGIWLKVGAKFDEAEKALAKLPFDAQKAATEMERAFKAVGIRNLEKEFRDANSAFEMLKDTGTLTARQLADGAANVREKWRAWKEGIDDSADALKNLGIIANVQVYQALQNVGSTLTNALTRPILDAGGAALKLGSDFQQAQIAFSTMLGSGERANKFLAELKTFAAGTPFEFPGLVDAAKRMMALGFSADQVVPSLRAIGDAAAALGGGAQMIDRVTLALGQMQSKGKVSAQEMNQLAEAGINAWKILADRMGKSIPEVMKLAEKGMINAARAVPEILDALNKQFGGMMEKQAKTITGQWSNIKDQITFIMMDLGKGLEKPASEAMDAMQPLLKVFHNLVLQFNELPPAAQYAALGIAGIAAGAGPTLSTLGDLGMAVIGIKSAASMLGLETITLAGTLGVLKTAAVLAAGAFAGWNLGKWLYENVEYFKRWGDGIADIIAKIPGVQRLIDSFAGIPAANKSLADSVTLLEGKLKNHGIVIDKTGLSLEEYSKRLRNAVQLIPSAANEIKKGTDANEKNYQSWLNNGNAMDKAAEAAKKAAAAIQHAFSALSLKDLKKEYEDSQKALDLLTAKGKLSGQQLETAIDNVRKKYVAWQDSMRGIDSTLATSASMGFKALNDLIGKHAEWVMQGVQQRLVNIEFEKTSTELTKMEAALLKSKIYLDPFVGGFLKAGEAMRALNEDAKTLGIVTGEQLAGRAREATEAYERMAARAKEGTINAIDLQKALVKSLEAQLAAAKAAGEPWKDLEIKLKSANEALGKMTGESTKNASIMGDAWKDFGKQVSTIFTDFGKDMASAILHSDNLGQAFTKMANSIKEAAMRTILEGALKQLMKGLDDVGLSFENLAKKALENLSAIGRSIAGIFGGGGTSVASGAAGAAGSAGSAGGAAGGAGGAAGGVLGVVGAIGSIGSLISGVIGNFQMSGMNKTLDLIEKEVRYSQIHLKNMLEFANQWWPWMENLKYLQIMESLERATYESVEYLRAMSGGGQVSQYQQTTVNWLKNISEGVWATYQAVAKPGWQTNTTPRFTTPSVPTTGTPISGAPNTTVNVNVVNSGTANPYTLGMQIAQGINAALPARTI